MCFDSAVSARHCSLTVNSTPVIFLLSVGIAATVPHLDLLISLIGALSSSAIALIFPPILELIVAWPDELGACKWKIGKNVLLILFGFIGFVSGTVTTLIHIAKAFSGNSDANLEIS